MRNAMTILLLAAAAAVFGAAPAPAADGPRDGRNIQAAIEVRAGKLYDYVLIGMNLAATDGLDHAYDTVAPGVAVADQYILAAVPHPEWAAVKTDYRTDYRSLKPSETWDLRVTTNLPDGTVLTLSLDGEQSKLPRGCTVTVTDQATGMKQDLEKGAYVFPVRTSGIAREFQVTIARRTRDHKDGDRD